MFLLFLLSREFVFSDSQLDVVSTLYHQESVDDDEFFEEGASENDDGVSPKEVSSSFYSVVQHSSRLGEYT